MLITISLENPIIVKILIIKINCQHSVQPNFSFISSLVSFYLIIN